MYIPPRRIGQIIREPYKDRREMNRVDKTVSELIDKTNKDVQIYYDEHVYDCMTDTTEYIVNFVGTRKLKHYLKIFIAEFKRDNKAN